MNCYKKPLPLQTKYLISVVVVEKMEENGE
jgi:hypothetical protein